jgi:pimeloyl-ACP methyl ester carboxylesterase
MIHQYIETNGVTLHVVTDGDMTAPLIILLHGFPEAWFGWEMQIPALVAAGFRVWVPDQRGYNLSAKPKGIKAYTHDELARDVIGLIDAAGVEKAYLVGHDWGGSVAWWTAACYPQRLHKLAILNVPHPKTMMRFVRTNRSQMRKSYYILLFQIPLIAEFFAKRFGTRALRRTSRAGTFSDAALARYQAAWAQPNAMRSMLNWYRAVVRVPTEKGAHDGRIRVPVQILWGEQDAFFDQRIAPLSLDWCDDGELIRFPTATHWIQHEEATRVNQALVAWFTD